VIVFDRSGSGKTNDREITVVIFENGNGSITMGGMTQRNSALTKIVIRNHIESQRNIAKSLQVSKLS